MGLPPSKLEWEKFFPYAKLAGSSGPRTILRCCFNLWVFCYFWQLLVCLALAGGCGFTSYFGSRAHSHCLAASYWGKLWLGQRILFQCDNSAAVQALQKYTSRSPHLLKLLRHMAYFAIKFNFNFSAVHVEGILNQKADALSRFRFRVFRELCPSADAVASDIDPTLFKDLICPPYIHIGIT